MGRSGGMGRTWLLFCRSLVLRGFSSSLRNKGSDSSFTSFEINNAGHKS